MGSQMDDEAFEKTDVGGERGQEDKVAEEGERQGEEKVKEVKDKE